jgi:hypothetical protein
VSPHAQLIVDVRKALGLEPDLVLWPNNNGIATFGGGQKVKYGLQKGAADLIGIGPGGVFVAWEFKTGKATTEPEQKRFLSLVEKRGGHSAVIRSVDDAWAALRVMRERASRLLQPA